MIRRRPCLHLVAALFPALLLAGCDQQSPEPFSVEVRDAQGNRLGEMRVAATVQFVVTTPNGRQTYRRSITDGKNTVTLPLSP